jgi:hypothetical protein
MEFLAAVCTSASLCVLSLSFNYVCTGHHDISKDRNEDPGNKNKNESFELVWSDSVHRNINFNDGKTVKICVSFENNKFPIVNARDFFLSMASGGMISDIYWGHTYRCNNSFLIYWDVVWSFRVLHDDCCQIHPGYLGESYGSFEIITSRGIANDFCASNNDYYFVDNMI